MQVETTRFGQLRVAEHQVITFPRGLFAFDDCFRFVLLEKGASPLGWLQSLEHGELAFVVIDPRLVFADYCPEVTRKELSMLGLSRLEEAAIRSIVTVPACPRNMTVNLQAPLLIHPNTMLAQQLISSHTDHALRQPLFAALSAAKKKKTG